MRKAAEAPTPRQRGPHCYIGSESPSSKAAEATALFKAAEAPVPSCGGTGVPKAEAVPAFPKRRETPPKALGISKAGEDRSRKWRMPRLLKANDALPLSKAKVAPA